MDEGGIAVIVLAFAVLNIVLFFKVWGMTNNVARIVEILEKETGNTGKNLSKEEEAATQY